MTIKELKKWCLSEIALYAELEESGKVSGGKAAEYTNCGKKEAFRDMYNKLAIFFRGPEKHIQDLQAENNRLTAAIMRCLDAMKGSNCLEEQWLREAIEVKE
jgi:hypothetical protein